MSIFKKMDFESIIRYLEKDRFSILTAFIYFVIIGIIRSVFESLIFEFPNFSLYLLAQHTAFNFPVFVMGVMIIKIATDAPLRKIYNIVLIGMFLVTLPPLIDYLAFGYSGIEYSYLYRYYGEGLSNVDRIAAISPNVVFANERISPGLRMMLFSITSMSTFYVAFKVKIWKIKKLLSDRLYQLVIKKFSAVFFGGMGIWLVMVFINATVPILIRIQEEGILLLNTFKFQWEEKYFLFFKEYGYVREEIFPAEFGIAGEVGMAEALTLQQRSLFITMYFFIVTALFLIITLKFFKPDVFKKIISKIKFHIVFIVAMFASLGNAVNHLIDPDYTKGYALDPTYILHFPYIFYIFMVGLFLGLFASFIWSYYSGSADRYLEKQLIITSILGGLAFSILLGGIWTISLYGISVVILWAAFRTDKKILDLTSGILFSIGNLLIFLYGFYSPSIWKLRSYEFTQGIPDSGTYTTINLSRTPHMTALIIALLLTFVIMVFACIYVSRLVSEEKLVYPKTYLILPIFLSPLLFLHDPDQILVFSILGLIASTLVDKETTDLPLYMISLLFLYAVLRLMRVIQL